MAPAHAQFNKPTPMANQSNHRGAPYVDRSLSGRRMQNSIEVEEVDHIPYRQPFGAVKINRNSMRPSETQEKSCGKASPRSLVRHIAPEERSHQKKMIRHGATVTRHLASGTPNKASKVHNSHHEIQVGDKGEYYDYDQLSTVSEYSFKNSNADNLPEVEDWDDNESVASFYSKASVRNAQKNILDREELVDMDEDTMSQFHERSKYRDITGEKTKNLVNLNNQTQRGMSDSESDLEVDFGNIESNLKDLALHKFYLRDKYAEYNEPVQQEMDKVKKNIEKIVRKRKLHGRDVKKSRISSLERVALRSKLNYKEDDLDKENNNMNNIMDDIKHNLQSGKLHHRDLTFNKDLLNSIDFGDYKNSKHAQEFRSRSRNQSKERHMRSVSRSNSRAIKENSRKNLIERNSNKKPVKQYR